MHRCTVHAEKSTKSAKKNKLKTQNAGNANAGNAIQTAPMAEINTFASLFGVNHNLFELIPCLSCLRSK